MYLQEVDTMCMVFIWTVQEQQFVFNPFKIYKYLFLDYGTWFVNK